MKVEFFDIFGFIGFLILFIIGIKMLTSKKKLPDWVGILVILISLIGLVIDGYIVIKTYLV